MEKQWQRQRVLPGNPQTLTNAEGGPKWVRNSLFLNNLGVKTGTGGLVLYA